MQAFFISFLQTSLVMTGVISLFLILRGVVRKSMSSRLKYYIWIVLLIGLLIPHRAWFNLNTPEVPISQTIQTHTSPLREGGSLASTAADGSAVSWIAYLPLIFIAVWVAGMILKTGLQIYRYNRYKSLLKRWREPICEADILERFAVVREEVGLESKPIQLYWSAMIQSPMQMGMFHCDIYLPYTLNNPDEAELVMRHEAVHYRRHDLWYKFFVNIVTIIHWFNPVVIFAAKIIENDCEEACDSQVVMVADIEEKYRYVDAILGATSTAQSIASPPRLTTQFLGGTKNMKRRITNILENKRNHVMLLSFTGILLLASVIFLGNVFGKEGPSLSLANNNPAVENTADPQPENTDEPETENTALNESSAKTLALQMAGVNDSAVTWQTVVAKTQSDVPVYVLVFTTDSLRYEYVFNTETRAVIKAISSPYSKTETSIAPSTVISEAEASSIAISRVGGGRVTKIEYDEGDARYDVEVLWNGVDYDLEISSTGNILLYEVDD